MSGLIDELFGEQLKPEIKSQPVTGSPSGIIYSRKTVATPMTDDGESRTAESDVLPTMLVLWSLL